MVGVIKELADGKCYKKNQLMLGVREVLVDCIK